MPLTEQRKGEIALALWKNRRTHQGVRFSPTAIRREIGNAAKETGIPFDELMEFSKEVIEHVFAQTFPER
jgi:hypothetical protein